MTLDLPTTGRKCDCDLCREHEWVKNFRDRLPEEFRAEFYAFYDSLFNKEAELTMELAVLNSQIEGTWPKEDGEKYYHRIGNKLYEIHSTFVKEDNYANQQETQG